MSDPQTMRLIDRTAYDASGDKIGTIKDIYVDEITGRPEWLAVSTGLFGQNNSFVPLQGVESDGDNVIVPFSKDQVKDAPNCDADGRLSPAEEEQLYRHYNVSAEMRSDSGRQRTTTTTPTGTGTTGTPTTGTGTTGRGQRTSDDAMTRSEEKLDVTKEERPVGRARLRKWIETEDQHFTVPVRREKARVVREPITDANRGDAMSGEALTEDDHEIVLNEERVDIDKHVEPKERVRLEKDVETEQVEVDEKVRKERIDVDRDANRDKRRS
jgi:uncharacterized protein (TIGR02271 family)